MDFTLTTSIGEKIDNGSVFSIVPEKIRTFMKITSFEPFDIEKYCDWKGNNYLPISLIAESEKYPSGTICLRDESGNVQNFHLKDGKNEITNLYPGMKYEAILFETGSTISFETNGDFPRTISLPGTDNTRDLGGKTSADGKRTMKYGRCYRGGWLRTIGEEGMDVLLKDLNITTELDLTGGGESLPALDGLLKKEFHSIRWYQWLFEYEDEYTKQLLQTIRLFENEENYPFYFHCSLGRDRTGTLAFILQALCGVSKEDLYREQMLSFFSLRGDGENAGIPAHLGNINALYNGFMGILGEDHTIQENVEAYLLKIGMTEDEFEVIREKLC